MTDSSGTVVRASQALGKPLPTEDTDEARLAGADYGYVVVTEDASAGGQEYVVSVAVSLEEVDDSTSALIPLLLVGVPLVLLVVGGTTWMVATRALAPVERIRGEVEQITSDRLDRRVPEPSSRDEIHRLALTMNQMLGRLQASRDRQQQFVADASHELRSPLANIRQTAEVAHTHPGALPEGELADAVLAESARMQRLVEQLLVLTRADEGAVFRTVHDVDLDDLALAEASRVRRNGLDVDTTELAHGRVRGDRASLAQVVRNLVDNAARHSDARIAMALRESGRPGRAERGGRRSRDRRGPAGTGLRAVRPARRGARPGRGRERARPGHRQGDRHRARRDGRGLLRGAGWRPVRRTAPRRGERVG